MDSPLFYTQVVPIVTLVILIFAIIEAAGSSDKYNQLPENTSKLAFVISLKLMHKFCAFFYALNILSHVATEFV